MTQINEQIIPTKYDLNRHKCIAYLCITSKKCHFPLSSHVKVAYGEISWRYQLFSNYEIIVFL